jgi:peptide/nickel transport system permease protein
LVIGGLLSAGFGIVGCIGLAMILVPSLNHFYLDQNLLRPLARPPAYGLGTDVLGRNVLARVVAGVGISLTIAVAVTVLSLAVGGAIGLVAGYYGGMLDLALAGAIDLAWGFPTVLLAIMLAGVLGPGLPPVIIGISLGNWAGFARLIRGEVLKFRERDYVTAARAMGASDSRILFRHLAPSVAPAVLVLAMYYAAVTIIIESGLSYIGLGAQPPTPSLGSIIADGQDYILVDPWAVIVPGVVLVVLVIGLNLLSDGLRDALDPRREG